MLRFLSIFLFEEIIKIIIGRHIHGIVKNKIEHKKKKDEEEKTFLFSNKFI